MVSIDPEELEFVMRDEEEENKPKPKYNNIIPIESGSSNELSNELDKMR